jgi:hypothetical protein
MPFVTTTPPTLDTMPTRQRHTQHLRPFFVTLAGLDPLRSAIVSSISLFTIPFPSNTTTFNPTAYPIPQKHIKWHLVYHPKTSSCHHNTQPDPENCPQHFQNRPNPPASKKTPTQLQPKQNPTTPHQKTTTMWNCCRCGRTCSAGTRCKCGHAPCGTCTSINGFKSIRDCFRRMVE